MYNIHLLIHKTFKKSKTILHFIMSPIESINFCQN